MTHESIVIQIGSYANFIGAHWWNLQESSFIYDSERAKLNAERINHDVLFREGSDIRNDFHYTPRLIVIDDKSNIGCCQALRRFKTGAEDDDRKKATTSWNSEATIIDQRMSRSNILLEKAAESTTLSTPASLNHDENVKTWTDFLRVPYHPKSVASFSNIVQDDVITKYIDGYLFAQTESFGDELESKFRFFVEDCDHLQGFNVISDVHDAFSGISGSVLQYVRDESPKCTIVCYPVLPPQVMLQSKNDSFEEQNVKIQDKWTHSNHISNLTMSLCKFLDESDFVLPLTLLETLDKNCNVTQLILETSSLYHTSAILASAIESSTVPWRVMNKSHTMGDLVTYMTEFQRKLAVCQIDFLLDNDFNFDFVPLSPECAKMDNDRFARSIVSLQGANIFCKMPYDRDETEKVSRKLESIFSEKKNLCYLTSDGQILKPYYPSIFEAIRPNQRTSDSIKSIKDPSIYLPVITEIETSRKVEKLIDLLIANSISAEARRLKLNSDMSDFVAEILQSTKKCYETE